jgi:hypothetical protein
MIATYRLSERLASFEFFSWLVMVQADGATKIAFDVTNPKLKNFTLNDVMRRFHSIVEPGPALAGMQCYFASDETKLNAVASQLIPWVRSGRTFSRLKSVKPPVECKYTVTIRANKGGASGRDSNRVVWTQFAKEIDAILIDDYYSNEIRLHDRVALYAGAKMNFGVCNGPIHMLSLTAYPVTMFVNTQSAENSSVRWGLQPGQKFPWMLPNQNVIWKKDNSVDALLQTL